MPGRNGKAATIVRSVTLTFVGPAITTGDWRLALSLGNASASGINAEVKRIAINGLPNGSAMRSSGKRGRSPVEPQIQWTAPGPLPLALCCALPVQGNRSAAAGPVPTMAGGNTLGGSIDPAALATVAGNCPRKAAGRSAASTAVQSQPVGSAIGETIISRPP